MDSVLLAGRNDLDRAEIALHNRISLDRFTESGRRARRYALTKREHGQQRPKHISERAASSCDRLEEPVDIQNQVRLIRDFPYQGSEFLLELPAGLWRINEALGFHRKDARGPEEFGDVAVCDSLCQAFDNRSLADSGLAH